MTSKISGQIRKSPKDQNEYQYRVLSNGLQALIVYDKDADISAAALTVNVGSLCDPKEYSGLAHFLEHMLFMGNEKYPKEDEYQDFIKKNGGSYNAFTDHDQTKYFFSVSNEALNGALDRFAQFFIKPLFLQSSLDKEMKAVNSEHEKNILQDNWRQFQLIASEANPKSCCNHFNTGNLSTINKPDIRDQLLAFYEKYYTSEIMQLVVVSNQPFEQMGKYIEELFSQVPKKENYIKPKYDDVMPYDSSNLGYQYKILPISDLDSLSIIWYLPDERMQYKKKPLQFLNAVFTHKDSNSLTESLIKDNLISDTVGTYIHHESGICTMYFVSIQLTKTGLEQYEEIIKRIFKYISVFQKQEICKRYFNEKQNVMKMAFDNKIKDKSETVAQNLSGTFHLYAIEDLLIGREVTEEYDEKLIEKYLNLLNLSNCNIHLGSPKFKEECTSEEKWYGTKFTKTKFTYTQEILEKYECKDSFGYPSENDLIPTDLELLPKPTEINEYPVIIYKEEDYITVWHKQDTKFNVPNAAVICTMHLDKDLHEKTKTFNSLMSSFINPLIQEELQNIISQALEAYLAIDVSYDNNTKFSLSLAGFNKSMKTGMKKVLDQLMKLDLKDKEDRIKSIIETKIQENKNFYLNESYVFSWNILYTFLSNNKYTKEDELEELTTNKNLNLENVIRFGKDSLQNIRYEWLIQGNISKEEAIEIAQSCKEMINSKPLCEDKIEGPRCVIIDSNHHYIYQKIHPTPEESNSSIVAYFEAGNLNPREIKLLSVLKRCLDTKFFTELRTNQQLGYVVLTTMVINEGIYGLGFVVQSDKKSPEYISERINIFLNDFIKQLEEMPEAELQEFINAEITSEKEKHNNIYEEATSNFTEISRHRYTFDRKIVACQNLATMKKEEIVAAFKEYFINNVKRLDIEYVAPCHKEENDAKHIELNDKAKNIKRIKVTSVQDFRRRNTFSPSYYMLDIR